MARRPFGGTSADVAVDRHGDYIVAAVLTAWTAATGGTQVTDLQDTPGAALSAGHILSGSQGQVRFLGPPDGTASLWIDGGAGARFLMQATDAPARILAIEQAGPGGTGAVASVNGHTGVVVLVASDVGADAAGAAAAAQSAAATDATNKANSAQSAATSAATTAAATDATAKVLVETNARITAAASKADLVAGLVPTSQLPALALTTAVPVANQAAMLALTSSQVQPGDIAVRADGAGSFILSAVDPSVLGNWLRLNAPTDAVTSVNGQTGTVVLSATDVGADTVAARNAAIAAASATSQPVDADLTTIAALDSTVAGVLSTDGSGWANKTPAQARTILGLGTAATQPATAFATKAQAIGYAIVFGGL